MIHHKVTWDWKDTIDIDEVNYVLEKIKSNGGYPCFYETDTGGDSYGVLISEKENLSTEEAQKIFEQI